jgi:hypothetical protein
VVSRENRRRRRCPGPQAAASGSDQFTPQIGRSTDGVCIRSHIPFHLRWPNASVHLPGSDALFNILKNSSEIGREKLYDRLSALGTFVIPSNDAWAPNNQDKKITVWQSSKRNLKCAKPITN